MIMYLILLLMILVTLIIKSKKSLHMLQQNLYNENNRYLKWVFKNSKDFINIDILAICLSAICLFIFYKSEGSIIGILIALVACFGYESYRLSIKSKNEQTKKPLVVTKRVRRLIITTTILYLIPVVVGVFYYNDIQVIWLLVLILTCMVYLNYFIVFLANIINFPYERGVYHYYKHKAQSTLKSMPNLKIIGITGSYGKSTLTDLISKVLETEMKVLHDFYNDNNNTRWHLSRLLQDFDNYDIAVLEIGTSDFGRITSMSKLVKPSITVINSIGTAHINKFKTKENILEEKMHIVDYIKDKKILYLLII